MFRAGLSYEKRKLKLIKGSLWEARASRACAYGRRGAGFMKDLYGARVPCSTLTLSHPSLLDFKHSTARNEVRQGGSATL